MRTTITLMLPLLLVLGLLGTSANAATDPADACKDAKSKGAGKKASELLKAFGKNLKKPDPTKLAASVSKAQSKVTKAFGKAEAKGGCLTTGDVSAIEAKVDGFVLDVLDTVRKQRCRYVVTFSNAVNNPPLAGCQTNCQDFVGLKRCGRGCAPAGVAGDCPTTLGNPANTALHPNPTTPGCKCFLATTLDDPPGCDADCQDQSP